MKSITAIGTRRMAHGALLQDEPCSRLGHPSRGRHPVLRLNFGGGNYGR
ncbi:MAG: hypothetical protein OXC31_01070 [Spirochaetaceae bacterium]|nr:hypothetical protein [Spirochaetaceae bacterium]